MAVASRRNKKAPLPFAKTKVISAYQANIHAYGNANTIQSLQAILNKLLLEQEWLARLVWFT